MPSMYKSNGVTKRVPDSIKEIAKFLGAFKFFKGSLVRSE
jgi:hypothetical protein